MGRISRYSNLLGKVIRYVRDSSVGPVLATVRRNSRERKAYQEWVRRFGTVTEEQRREYRGRTKAFGRKPLISVVLPVYNVDEDLLRKCVASVTDQIYPHWQLCIADDASTKAHIRPTLQEFAGSDDRIKVVLRESNGHISAASNSALELADGEFTVLLDHDDELSEDALFWLANEINEYPETAMIYSDEDLIDESGVRSGPKFKPDFSRDLLYGINLVTHLSAYRTSILKEIGGFRVGYEGSQDYDLALRVVEKLTDDQIRHIPRILYHWRITAGSLAHDLEAKPYAHESARRAIREHLERIGKKAEVVETGYLHRVRHRLPADPPRVSVIVHGLRRAGVEDALLGTNILIEYPNVEWVYAENPTGRQDVKKGNEQTEQQTLAAGIPAIMLNNAVAEAGGEILCFLAAGSRSLDADWLSELISFAIQPEIGAVGPRMLFPDNTIAGSGLVLGAGGTVAIAHEGFLRNAPGNMSRNRLISNYSAVSSACMVVRREVFEELGGFNENDLPEALFGVDLCLRIREKGLRIVVTPFAELKWASAHKPPVIPETERVYFNQRWRDIVENDPFYNPNLSTSHGGFSIKT